MYIGKLVATCILQGGPGFPVFLPAVYHYISTKVFTEMPIAPSVNFVVSHLLDKVGNGNSNNKLLSSSL